MPEKTKSRNAASRTRISTYARSDKKRSRRPGSDRTTQGAPKIIANSLFALTLKNRPAIEVHDKLKEKRSYGDNDDFEKMYKDLLVIFKKSYHIVTGETTKCDPLREGMGIGESLSYVLNGFKNNVVPKGWEVHIEKTEEGSYYFAVFKECPFPGYWCPFEIKPIVYKLKKTNPKLHDFFLQFMSSFISQTNMGTWYNGGFGYSEFALEEKIGCWDDYHEGEDEKESMQMFQDAVKTLEDYESGEVSEYAEKIKTANTLNEKQLLRGLSKFSKKSLIVKWMYKALAFMKLPGSISDFYDYDVTEDYVNDGALPFYEQVTIIWNWDDAYTSMQRDYIDSAANNCGTVPPMNIVRITSKTKEIDFKKEDTYTSWPKELNALWNSYDAIISRLVKRNYYE